MAGNLGQIINMIKSLPPSKRIVIGLVPAIIIIGFIFLFVWANQEDYQVLFNNLNPEDGGVIISKLKEMKVPYKIKGNGTVVLVPTDRVYELRLTLAQEGIPNGGNVGFEIFDKIDFRTPKMVQELNYRRALQGELARTINYFKEVKNARVFIAIPKESVFVEEAKPPSASIQLDLKSPLPPQKLRAIVNLVSNAVAGLEPENVTVVDTTGRIIFNGSGKKDENLFLSESQIEYKEKLEEQIKNNIQSMLEQIVGHGKAIVRVNADIDFTDMIMNTEEYDPSSAVIRSMKSSVESVKTGKGANVQRGSMLNQRAGILPSGADSQKTSTKKNTVTNYEINKVIKKMTVPSGRIKRLSVAVVVDGKYRIEKKKDGSIKKIYIPRTKEELKNYEELVKKAMGYNEDREDQVSVTSVAFSEASAMPDFAVESKEKGFSLFAMAKEMKKTFINLVLIAMVFFFIIRPIIKSLRDIKIPTSTIEQKEELTEDEKMIERPEDKIQIPEVSTYNNREKIIEITEKNPQKAQQIIKNWINEG